MLRTLHIEPGEDPGDALAAFDLSVTEIHERIVRPAIISTSRVSPLSSRAAPGSRMNEEMIAGVRGVLLPKDGWELDKLNDGVSRAINLDRRIAIVPATGNEKTGHSLAGLTTKNKKGAAAFTAAAKFEAVGFEAVDNSGFDWKTPPPEDEVQWILWYLLHRREGNKVYLELSAPAFLDDSGFPRGWLPRIAIPPYDIVDPEFDASEDFNDNPDDGDIDVPIRKK